MGSPSYGALAAEIDRITSSPYPSQLRTLCDLVAKCSRADIATWASAKPCLIDPLISCLLESLQQWPYVLDIIAMFALDAACRDAFLRQEPSLLHAAVAQAIVKSGNAGSKSRYTRASVALLSRPLPDTVALPADVQLLFTQLVEDAVRRPSTATIEPVYSVLAGTGSLLLGVLNDDILLKFENQLLDIFKHAGVAGTSSLSLYCLSIMSIVCGSVDLDFKLTNTSSFKTDDFLASTPTSSRWRAEAMQQFFTGRKAETSTNFTVLLVMWASKTVADESASEKLRSLILANEVILAIPLDTRKNWCNKNPIVVRKLQERLSAEDLDHVSKTLTLRFIGKLCNLESLCRPVLEALELTFLEQRSLKTVYTHCPHVDDNELFSSLLARAPITLLLENAVDYALCVESAEVAAGAAAVRCMVADAQWMVASQRNVVHEVSELLQSGPFLQKLRMLQILLANHDLHMQQHPGLCAVALRRKQCQLAHQISKLLLRTSQASTIASQTMTLLLDLHALSAKGDVQCSHGPVVASDTMATIALQTAVIEDESDHGDWREALHTHFLARAGVEEDALRRLFTKACASLEVRCESVEKPLREEQHRRRELEKAHEQLEQAFADLESRHIKTTIRSRDLTDERDLLASDFRHNQEEIAELLSRISILEHTAREAQNAAEKQLAEIRMSQNLADLDAAAILAHKQAELEDAQDAVSEWTAKYEDQVLKVSDLERDLAGHDYQRQQFDQERAALNAKVENLLSAARDQENQVVQLKAYRERIETDLRNATNSNVDREQRLSETQTSLQACRSERDALEVRLGEQADTHRQFLEQNQREISHLTHSHQEAFSKLQSQLSTAHHDLQTTKANSLSDLCSHEAKISDLKKRISHYSRKCEQKDSQILEAEAMRANLMATLGIPSNIVPVQGRKSLVVREGPTPPTATSAANDHMVGNVEESQNLDNSFMSNSSQESAKSGPAPKRARPATTRKSLSFAAPLMKTTTKYRQSTGVLKSKQSLGGADAGRQALQSVSGNRTKATQVRDSPEMLKRAATKNLECREDGDETTFDGSELFGGTQAMDRLSDIQSAFEEES